MKGRKILKEDSVSRSIWLLSYSVTHAGRDTKLKCFYLFILYLSFLFWSYFEKQIIKRK